MASVFLSYDRDDSDRARHFAQALEKAGHQVWWDLHVRGGAQFGKVIEEALKAADAVVVLWSKHSVESAWVKDEAAAGRDTNRLVPVTIDGTQPPLGFRQFQTIDLSGWRGRSNPEQLRALLADVSALAGDQEPRPGPSKADQSDRPSFRWQLAVALPAALVLAALAGLLLLWRPWSPPAIAVAAVVPADSSNASRVSARDLLASLGQLQSVRSEKFELVGPADRKRAGLVFEVAATADAQQVRSSLVLHAEKGGILWSKNFQRPLANAGDLREEVGYAAAQVLQCAVEAHALSREIVKLYLNGCAQWSDPDRQDSSDLAQLFRRVTAAAPDFEGAWGKLILVENDALAHAERGSPEARRLEPQLRRDIASARKLNRDMAEAYVAEVDLLPFNAFGQRLELVDRAISRNPSDSRLLVARATLLQAVGRVADALDDSGRAVELNPFSPQVRSAYIYALAASGRTDAALKEVDAVERLWPGSSTAAGSRFAVHLRYGDPRTAWQLIQAGKTQAGWIAAKSFLDARLDPTPEKVSEAIKKSRGLYAGDAATLHNLVQVLSILQHDDELLPLLMSVPLDQAAYVSDVTFRPAAREFWHDPRSLAYAKRIGLLQYWRSSGKWPDFCRDTDLPYDCKAEAAKLK